LCFIYCFEWALILFQLLEQAQSLHRHFQETLKLPPRSAILIMADVCHSAAWLTTDVAALFGGYLCIPMNVNDSASSVSQVIARHQVLNHFSLTSAKLSPVQVFCCVFVAASRSTVETALSM
jgi:hypothetical protein